MLRRRCLLRNASTSAAAAAAAGGRGLVTLDTETHRLSAKATVATLTLNSPTTRNALTEAMGDEFAARVAELRDGAQHRDVRAVVLTGAGDAAFSAGGDVQFLRARLSDTPEGNVRAMRAFYARFLALRSLRVPVVAAVNGHAIGAGLCVALACDVRVVAAEAKLAINFVRLGISPGMGGTFWLRRLAGENVASRMILTGETISGAEAVRLGLAAESAAGADATVARAVAVAKGIATASPIAVECSLRTLRAEDATALEAALQNEAEMQAQCYSQRADLAEALDAMREKRTPTFV